MSWKAEVKVANDPKWNGNALRFETRDEAQRYVEDLFYRWTSVTETQVTEVEDPVKHVFTKDGKLVPLVEGKF